MKSLSFAVGLLFALTTSLSAQTTSFRINEVIFGVGSADDIVELINVTGSSADLAGLNMCANFTYAALPSTNIAAGGTVRVHVGKNGVNTGTDLFTGTSFPTLSSASGQMSLYKSGNGFPFFSNAANLIDFLQWGLGDQPRADLAVMNGVWPSTGAALATVSDGQSLAWDGDGELLSDWFRDASPTSNAPNFTATAAIEDLGPGCDIGFPDLLTASGVAALGNLDLQLNIATDNPSAPAILFAGIGALDATVAVVCHFYVSPLLGGVQIAFNTNAAGNRTLPIFVEDPTLAGLGISLQAAVANTAMFPKFDLTSGLLVTF